MKVKKSVIILAIIMAAGAAQAENVIRISVPIEKAQEKWISASDLYSEWIVSTEPMTCSAWLPLIDSQLSGVVFDQTSQCLKKYSRTAQSREVNNSSGIYRNVGDPKVETKSEPITLSQSVVGTGTECHVKDTNYGWSWDDYYGGDYDDVTRLYWGGVNIFTAYHQTSSSYVVGGYTYTKISNTSKETSYSKFQNISYTICRK
jgi:hypothetical protein